MLDDRTLRIILGSAFFGLYFAFKGTIDRWLYRLGYRDGSSQTGWKRGLKIGGIAMLITAGLLLL